VTAAEAFERVRVLAACGRAGEARVGLDRLLADEPRHVPALILKGGLLMEEREPEQALALFERAAALDERSAEAWNAVARARQALGRLDEALQAAENARRLLDEGDNYRQAGPVYLTLVWCLREQRRFEEALARAEEGLRRSPDAVLAHWAGIVEEELAEAQQERC
jgi:tetratricopeptide (TPR) repeat protein